MERIKQMNLKRALFTIALLHITAAIILSAFSFWGCMQANAAIAPQSFRLEFLFDDYIGPVTVAKEPAATDTSLMLVQIISILQVILPVFICILSLLSTAYMFYRLKLKEPLEALTKGARHMMDNDLDFTVTATSEDELGQLCTAFETMRKALLENNRQLWKQAEERKRLNAAFSHNLRNPVTVLKGATKLAQKSIHDNNALTTQLAAQLSLMENYTDRIACYIEAMSSIHTLEEMPLAQQAANWDALTGELEHAIHLIALNSGKQIRFEAICPSCLQGAKMRPILIDSSVLFQIMENLVANALRFAREKISVSCSIKDNMFLLSVSDDGGGFPATFIRNGIRPFQTGITDIENTGHFGMGLYTCALLARKHRGDIEISNAPSGAVVSVSLEIKGT